MTISLGVLSAMNIAVKVSATNMGNLGTNMHRGPCGTNIQVPMEMNILPRVLGINIQQVTAYQC